MKKLISAFLLCAVLSVQADEWEDINKSIRKMYALENFSFSLEVKLFKNSGDLKPEIDYTGEARKRGKDYYSSVMGRSVIYNANTKELVHINHDRKTIIYSKTIGEGAAKVPKVNEKQILQLDSMILAGCKATYIKNDASLISVKLTPTKPFKYKTIILEIDPKTFLLKRVVYDPKQIEGMTNYAKIEILYKNFTAEMMAGSGYFDTRKYVSVSGKEVTLTSNYKTYRLVNQLKS